MCIWVWIWALSFLLYPRVKCLYLNGICIQDSFLFLKDLKEAVYNSNQEVTSVKQLSAVYDYKTWLKPFIITPHNHTAPHNFLFRCNESGSSVMLYRNWSTDEWLPQTPNDGLMLLKVFMHVFRSDSLYIRMNDLPWFPLWILYESWWHSLSSNYRTSPLELPPNFPLLMTS